MSLSVRTLRRTLAASSTAIRVRWFLALSFRGSPLLLRPIRSFFCIAASALSTSTLSSASTTSSSFSSTRFSASWMSFIAMSAACVRASIPPMTSPSGPHACTPLGGTRSMSSLSRSSQDRLRRFFFDLFALGAALRRLVTSSAEVSITPSSMSGSMAASMASSPIPPALMDAPYSATGGAPSSSSSVKRYAYPALRRPRVPSRCVASLGTGARPIFSSYSIDLRSRSLASKPNALSIAPRIDWLFAPRIFRPFGRFPPLFCPFLANGWS